MEAVHQKIQEEETEHENSCDALLEALREPNGFPIAARLVQGILTFKAHIENAKRIVEEATKYRDASKARDSDLATRASLNSTIWKQQKSIDELQQKKIDETTTAAATEAKCRKFTEKLREYE